MNSKLQLYQEEKAGNIHQRQKVGTIDVDFSGRGQVP